MVDKDGKPYRVNAVAEGDQREAAAAANAVATVSSVSTIDHLNW